MLQVRAVRRAVQRRHPLARHGDDGAALDVGPLGADGVEGPGTGDHV
ncbi:hypothetical protein OG389_18985 [Streptomyces sp. NBC_00435]